MYHIYIKHDSEKEMGDNAKRQSKYISGTKLIISLYKGKLGNVNDPFIDLGTGTWWYKRYINRSRLLNITLLLIISDVAVHDLCETRFNMNLSQSLINQTDHHATLFNN